MKLLRSDKADSEIVGHIIILSLAVTGIAMITLVGVPTIYNMQDMANVRNVEQAFTVIDSRASKVSLGAASRQIIDVNLVGGSLAVKPNTSSDPSYVLIELKNDTQTFYRIPISMGKIVYRMGEREVAYEGGGVWSKYPAGSVMLSPPEFDYNGITLTFPVVNITGNFTAAGKGAASVNFEKKGDTMVVYPNATFNNPISENVTTAVITLRSEYYDAWADYFRSIALTRVNETPGNRTVSVTLLTPTPATNFSYGALASETIELGGGNTYIDSYNSSLGPYSSSRSGNGTIRATKLIDIGNGAIVNGSAMSGGVITGGANAKIMRDAYASSYGSVQIFGTKYPPVKGLSLGNTAGIVQNKMDEYKASNNNNNPSSGGCLTGAGNTTLNSAGWSTSTCTMYSGNYYLTTFTLDNNDKLIFNTSGDGINISVDSYAIDTNNGVNISVIGNYPVRMYLNRQITIDNNAEINRNTNGKSSLFQVVSSSPQDIKLDQGADFYGFIWAPKAVITIDNNAEVYGALVGSKFILKNNQNMHYDEALKNFSINVGSGETIMYLYITRNDVGASIS